MPGRGWWELTGNGLDTYTRVVSRYRMAPRDKPARSLIESSPDRPLLERALAMGVSIQAISRRFGFSTKAITCYRNRIPNSCGRRSWRHRCGPRRPTLTGCGSRNGSDLGNLAHQRARLLLGQDEAMEAGAIELMGSLSRVIHQNISLTGKYLGLFAQHHVSSQVNILLSEDYLRMRQALIMALKPFPEARRQWPRPCTRSRVRPPRRCWPMPPPIRHGRLWRQ